jgi:hypothetical protein
MDSYEWKMETLTVYDVDTGLSWLQIVHELAFLKDSATNKIWQGGIKSTEEVTFELVFTSGSDP